MNRATGIILKEPFIIVRGNLLKQLGLMGAKERRDFYGFTCCQVKMVWRIMFIRCTYTHSKFTIKFRECAEFKSALTNLQPPTAWYRIYQAQWLNLRTKSCTYELVCMWWTRLVLVTQSLNTTCSRRKIALRSSNENFRIFLVLTVSCIKNHSLAIFALQHMYRILIYLTKECYSRYISAFYMITNFFFPFPCTFV